MANRIRLQSANNNPMGMRVATPIGKNSEQNQLCGNDEVITNMTHFCFCRFYQPCANELITNTTHSSPMPHWPSISGTYHFPVAPRQHAGDGQRGENNSYEYDAFKSDASLAKYFGHLLFPSRPAAACRRWATRR
jgi:hypothetical protein